MTIGNFLMQATEELARAGIDSARLDCLLILEDAFKVDRAHILAHPQMEIPTKTEVEMNKKIVQRTLHTPLAYIRGEISFYGRSFTVSPAVLVPRPESELMIELAKSLPLPQRPTIVDIGTGSGCLGITAGLEIAQARIILCDIDKKALLIATQNAKKYLPRAEVKQSDLFASYRGDADLVLANLPYVPIGYPINQAATYEPTIALFGGGDGIDLYRRFWDEISSLANPPQFILTESLPFQHRELAAIAERNGYRLLRSEGLIQCFRFSLSGLQPRSRRESALGHPATE